MLVLKQAGSNGCISAGADIKELEKLTFVDAYMGNFLQSLADGISAARKPVIAAVNGYAVSLKDPVGEIIGNDIKPFSLEVDVNWL